MAAEKGASAAQLELASLHPCTTCHGHGQTTNHETGLPARCPTCHGAGTLDYNPEDRSLIPF